MTPAQAIGEAVARRRNLKGMSQDELNRKAGLTAVLSGVRAIELGVAKSTLRQLLRVAQALDVKLSVLLQEADL